MPIDEQEDALSNRSARREWNEGRRCCTTQGTAALEEIKLQMVATAVSALRLRQHLRDAPVGRGRFVFELVFFLELVVFERFLRHVEMERNEARRHLVDQDRELIFDPCLCACI
jgi:hypothetical protein